MNFCRSMFFLLLIAGCGGNVALAAPQGTAGTATIRRVAVLGSSGSLELEISASERVTPQAQVINNPERLVIDFPNAVPGSSLHNLPINRGAVKEVRVGLFSTNPPVTRVVVDLREPQPYQLFPSGNAIIVKLPSGGRTRPVSFTTQFEVVNDDAEPQPEPSAAAPVTPAARFRVDYQNGNLTIWADKATLSEVLYEVQRKTGADIAIPSGAEQESVFATLGPGPARDVLASLLNGTNYNVVMVGSGTNPEQLRSVILSLKTDALPYNAAVPATPIAQPAGDPNAPPPPDPNAPPAPDPNAPPAQEPIPQDIPQ